jgi:hypothetical protein
MTSRATPFIPPTLSGLDLDLVNACEAGEVGIAYATVHALATNSANARNLSADKRHEVVTKAEHALRSLMRGKHSPASIHALVCDTIRTAVAELSP